MRKEAELTSNDEVVPLWESLVAKVDDEDADVELSIAGTEPSSPS